MTVEEYMARYPREQVFVQVDNVERIMTPEEYATWVEESVFYLDHYPYPT